MESRERLAGNLSPYIENEPVPSPFRKSPPKVDVVGQQEVTWTERADDLGT